MSLFDYVEFLDLARSLIGRTPGGSTDEAAWRSAVSRAYYAAYHVALDYAVSKALPPAVLPPGNKAGAHERLIRQYLQNFPKTDPGFAVGSELSDLKGRRVRADYRSPQVTKAHAITAARQADALIVQIRSLP